MVNKKILCKIGIHDKEIAGDGLACLNYIKRCLYKLKPIDDNDTIAVRRFFIGTDADFIFRSRYPQIRWDTDVFIKDYVCLRCGKCFKNIKFEKLMIEEAVKKYLDRKKNKEIRRQMAKDLYRENCEEH